MENTLKTKQPTKRDYLYFRQRQKNKVFQSVIAYFAKVAEEQGLTKKELACLLEKDPSQITRWFKGPGNWELDTISDLLLAMNAEMDFKITSLNNDQKTKSLGAVISHHRFGVKDKTVSSSTVEPIKIYG